MEDPLKEINGKYSAMEVEVEKKLEKINSEEEKLEKLEGKFVEKLSVAKKPNKILSYEEARDRNAKLLKSIEVAKARLRSRSTFSPVEQILEKAIENYKKDLMLSTPPPPTQETTTTPRASGKTIKVTSQGKPRTNAANEKDEETETESEGGINEDEEENKHLYELIQTLKRQ